MIDDVIVGEECDLDYFIEIDDKICAIVNSRERKDEQDVVMTSFLDTEKLLSYRRQRAAGCSDSTIFKSLYPSEDPYVNYTPPFVIDEDLEGNVPNWMEVSVNINSLNKDQLVPIVQDQIIATYSGLGQLGEEELRDLLTFLKRGREA